MKNKTNALIIATSLFTASSVFAQADFNLDGFGRSIFTSNKLGGKMVEGDTLNDKKSVAGYALFDLGTKIKYRDLFRAEAILRAKSPFGDFFGARSFFEFRQFLLAGKINENINYEIGDLNIGLTPYTVYNHQEMYSDFEADIYKERRSVLEYENFIFGNIWRLQGAQTRLEYQVLDTLTKIKGYGFGARTNASNNTSVPDRLLAGGNLSFLRGEWLELGFNYTGLLDVSVQRAATDYQSNVLTTNLKAFYLNNDNFNVGLVSELGSSYANYTSKTERKSLNLNDYFYDAKAVGGIKAAKINLFAGIKEVGPGFSSPAAQTTRLDVMTRQQILPTFSRATTQILFDRFTEEGLYNRNIRPQFYFFDPMFGNITPYGAATPNRRGMSFGASSDSSLKVIKAEVQIDMFSEIIGEGTTALRRFTGIKGGVSADLGKALGSKRLIKLDLGVRNENTVRDDNAKVDLRTNMLDAGLTVEAIKKIDIMLGLKTITAKGNEWIGARDEFNQLTDFTRVNYDETQTITSFGGRIRFADNSYFSINYNMSNQSYKLNENRNYNFNQLFLNYTIKL
ncbi:MAG: hypothetical protein SNJ77_01305 [Cytophagales bacterium]